MKTSAIRSVEAFFKSIWNPAAVRKAKLCNLRCQGRWTSPKTEVIGLTVGSWTPLCLHCIRIPLEPKLYQGRRKQIKLLD